ncbi:MAG: tripartite tricarboxylate transporter substrate binding protein [Candidatus Accumulibacter sp.]|jgi:tripartite-type tricarboxylate transporter receptor subunit TctC|nr:tripartite tricarboxylate transporter substrate binding protein [Accumulibacter sp.]
MSKTKHLITLLLGMFFMAGACAAWTPERPIEFIVTSGAGGGTDIFTRAIQSVIVKNKLIDVPILVVTKGGGAGSEGYVYALGEKANPYRVVFGTNNEYLLPLVAKMGYATDDFVPVAAMALDEFLIWVNEKSPYADARSFIEAARKGDLRLGGSQSKDMDQTVVSLLSEATGAKFTYIPFKSGGEAGIQLAGGHIDANTNNPNESVGQWKGSLVRPLCVFSDKRMAAGPKVTKDKAWSDIPTCRESGIPATYQAPRTLWLPAGVSPDVVSFYTDVLAKVRETPEWKAYIERTSQSDVFLTGEELRKYITQDSAKAYEVYKREKWLVQ